jgi:mRNA interferase MazF
MTIKRGEIYFVNLNPIKGREQAGKRPVLVLSIDEINKLPLVVTVVVGTKGTNISRDYPTNVRVSPTESGLPLETVFLGFQQARGISCLQSSISALQIRSLDSTRFDSKPAGHLTENKMTEIETSVRYCLGL